MSCMSEVMHNNTNQQEIVHNARILIVDDHEANTRLLKKVLEGAGYSKLTSTIDPREVIALFMEIQPDLILLDLMMPYLDGLQVMEQLQLLIPQGTYLPILVLTANISLESKRQALLVGAKDFLTKPFDSTEVLLRIKNLLETRFLYLQLWNQNQTLDYQVQERTKDLQKAQVEILERLARAAEYRDDITGQHTQRVGTMSAMLARALWLPDDQIELVRMAAPLHDVGKIAVSDAILLKPGKLTPDEFEVVKTHTTIGASILSKGHSELVKMAEVIALTHHEHWDGSGYPRGLEGAAIPIPGRIVSLVDVYDALTHERPYKEAWSREEAIAEIRRQEGKQFDPMVVDAFVHVPVGVQ